MNNIIIIVLQAVGKHVSGHHISFYKILLLHTEVELYQEMKDSEINELKSELQEKKDEWMVSELTSEVKTSKDADIQFDFTVPIEGEHI